MIVGLVSTYRDPLVVSAVSSLLPGCDHVVIGEGPSGPITDEPPRTAHGPDADSPYFTVVGGEWDSEARKKNNLLHVAKDMGAEWCVWLDSDEVLLWSEYLPDYFRHLAGETSVGGFGLRIVEPDGSVYRNSGRVIRPKLIRKYLMDWTQAELHTGLVVAFSHELLCTAGGIPALDYSGYQQESQEKQLEMMARLRPPLQGEPHILHRWNLRPPERQADALRMSTVEAEHWEGEMPR